MRGVKLFQAQIQRTVAGRFRWAISMHEVPLASGYAPTLKAARAQSLDAQRALRGRHGTMKDFSR